MIGLPESRRITVGGRSREAGAAAVEFALVAMLFFTLLIGIIEFGRVLFTWNAAMEATYLGARTAVVCDPGSGSRPAVLARMSGILPGLEDANLSLVYEPSGCNQNNCEWVVVGVTGLTVVPMIPLLGITLTVPPSTMRLPRESLDSAGGANPACA